MPNPSAPQTDRRQFLRMLAASPALPFVTLSPKILHALGQEPFREGGPADELIASPEEALTVFDFEAVAKESVWPRPPRSARRTAGCSSAAVSGSCSASTSRPSVRCSSTAPRTCW